MPHTPLLGSWYTGAFWRIHVSSSWGLRPQKLPLTRSMRSLVGCSAMPRTLVEPVPVLSRTGGRVEIAYTTEQEALRQELRAYFRELMTPEVQAEVAAGETGGPASLAAVRKMGADGWLGIGWPEGVRRPGRHAARAVHLHQRVVAGGRPHAVPQHQHRRHHHPGVRHAGAEGLLPAADPGRRAALLDRLHRAQLGHRPGVAHHQGGQGRRRVGHQRPEDLHQPRQLRRLRVARGPHRPRGPEAPRHHHLRGPHHRPRATRTRRSRRW